MRFLPLIFLPLITTLLIACPFDSTRNKPMLKYNPAEFYDGPALKMAEVIRNRDHAVLPTLVISQIQWVNSTGQKGFPLLAWTMGHDDLVAAEILLKAGANPNVTFPFGNGKMSLVSLAASMKNPGFLDLLLANGASPAGVVDTEPSTFFSRKG